MGSKSWWLTSISFHVNRSSHSWDTSILKIWPWKKSKVKVKAQGHIVGSTSYGLTSLLFHVNWPSHSWNTAFSQFDHENSKSRSWKRSKFKATTSVPLSIDSHQFRSMSNGPPIPVVLLFQHLILTRQIWGIWKLRPAYSSETPNLGQNRWCFVPCDLEIWWMTLENNRASLLCCFKLCATFHSHWWIQTGITVRKHPIWVKFDDF